MSYQPLPSHSGLDRVEKYGDNETPGSTEADSEDYPQPTPSKATISALVASLSLSVILNILFGILLYGRTSPSEITLSRAGSAESLYSPARDAIRYEQKVFDELGTRTIYHGPPNDETDQAWYDLYMVGLSRITKEEAAMLPNWTEPIVGDEDHYIITLDYIHQLHCLNMVRMALWPERYGEPVLGEPIMKDDPTPFDHVDHCINILRENIVCNADITPDPYQWDEDKRQIMPRFDSVRTCRNFEAIQEWQMQHRMTVPVETWKWTHVGN